MVTHTEEILNFYIYLGIKKKNYIDIFILFLTSKTLPGFYSFFSLREGSCRAGEVTLWHQLWLNHELHLGAPGATAADVQTITKVNSQSKSGVTGIENPFSLQIGNYKESLLDGEAHNSSSCASFPLLSASSVSHSGKQVRRLNPSEC